MRLAIGVMWMHSRLSLVLMLVSLSFLSGCTRSASNKDDPRGLLQDYISQSMAVNDIRDRAVLMHFLTGSAKTRLAAWSDDQFSDAFIKSKRQFVKLVMSDAKTVSPKQVSITYELIFLDQSKGHDAKVTHKKTAELVQNVGRWLISEVKNLKEMIEYNNEMSLP